jgi:hypothetical protein
MADKETDTRKDTDRQSNKQKDRARKIVSCYLFHLKSFKLIVAAFLESWSADFEKKII